MSLARFIADQRTCHRVPYAASCRALGVSPSWFYTWHDRPPTPRQRRRAAVDAAVTEAFEASRGLHGSPRVHADLRQAGWQVSEKTVAASMARHRLVARGRKRRKNLTRPGPAARFFPGLLKRGFTADKPSQTWVGDMTEVPTGEGDLCRSTVLGLFSRRLLGCATSCRPDAELAGETVKMAVAARGGRVTGVIFHTDRGSTYTAESFTRLCRGLGITRSMGRTGSCFDNAAAESFFPAWNTRCCRVTVSRLEKKPGKWLWNGATSSIISGVATARVA